MNGNSSIANRPAEDALGWTIPFLFALFITQMVLLSLTVLLAFGYTALIIARPAFRQNKLNWFTVNICLHSAFFCIFMFLMIMERTLNIFGATPCRVDAFFTYGTIGQVLYSHSVAALCRSLSVVHAAKQLFRSSGFTWVCIGSGCAIPLLVAFPYLFFDGFLCPSGEYARALSYYTLAVTILLPIAIVAVCNYRLLRFVRRSTRQVQVGTDRSRSCNARDIQLTKTLISSFVIVVIGWSPAFILKTFFEGVLVSLAWQIFAQIPLPLSMFMDVCLLIYSNQPVRLYLKQRILRQPQILPTNSTITKKN